MKNIFTLLLAAGLFLALAGNTYAQENHGGALNTFVKFGDNASIAANYEFQVANNITVSPEARFWFSGENDMALGGRADYYFDSLFGLPEKWDIWAGVDAGFLIGDGDSFTVNAHAGVEYRFTNAIGIIFEFAGGVTSSGGIGVAFHL
ncbi:MAG: hypothetical protein WBN13_05280 [Robiginitalea sp.]|uniref:hypothetical protein n=1 Tax=Robiginitalea sp. TaxID=1902411 RepID=UPI003C747039